MKHRAKSKLDEWQKIANQGGECRNCGRFVKKLSVDHIIPVYILDCLDDTGEAKYEWEDNFELLCVPCNNFKGAKLDKMNLKTKRLLMELL